MNLKNILADHDPGLLKVVNGDKAKLSRLSWKLLAVFILGFGGIIVASWIPWLGYSLCFTAFGILFWSTRDPAYRLLLDERERKRKERRALNKD